MSQVKMLANDCPNWPCPNIIDPEDGGPDVFVQGYETDRDAPPGEKVVRVPRSIVVTAGRRLDGRDVDEPREPLAAGPVQDFDALFDRFTASAFRLETLPAYNVGEEADEIAAWRGGQARPSYSVRTSPWAARLARTSIAGKSWRRVRVVDLPLSDYLRWEMAAYGDSAVVGEQIRILERIDGLGDLTRDFWLFDAAEAAPYVIDMGYDEVGTPGEHRLVVDRAEIADRYAALAERTWDAAIPLDEWVARRPADVCP